MTSSSSSPMALSATNNNGAACAISAPSTSGGDRTILADHSVTRGPPRTVMTSDGGGGGGGVAKNVANNHVNHASHQAAALASASTGRHVHSGSSSINDVIGGCDRGAGGGVELRAAHSTTSGAPSIRYHSQYSCNDCYVEESAAAATSGGNGRAYCYRTVELRKCELDKANKDKQNKLFSADFKVSSRSKSF